MGRLIDPMSEEEYKKLNRVQKFTADNPLLAFIGILLFLGLVAIIGYMLK